MIRMSVSIRMIYYAWVLINLVLLIFSGYFHKVALVLSLKHVPDFVQVHRIFYLYQSYDISCYDITEFLVAYLFPLLMVALYRGVRQPSRKYRTKGFQC
ncbi:MAG: hypothetical protein ACM3SM_08695 [Bacteroidota bacterium]